MLFPPSVVLPAVKLSEEHSSDGRTMETYRFGKLKVTVTSNTPSPKAVKAFNAGWNELANRWVDEAQIKNKKALAA